MLKKIGIAVAVLVLAVLVFAATKPDTIDVQRSASINAPPDKVYSLISDFHQWGSWSPWEKLDPAMKRTFSGATTGKGSVYEWTGNSKVGAGRMEITDTTQPSKVVIKLDFLKPMEAHNVTEFTLAPSGSATNVTWRMHGPNNYIGKVMSVFMNMDKMIGKDFESGLTNIKTVAER